MKHMVKTALRRDIRNLTTGREAQHLKHVKRNQSMFESAAKDEVQVNK